MTQKNKKLLLQLAGLLISVGLLAYIFATKVEWSELYAALKGANYWWLIPNVILILVTMVFRAFRWKYMIEPIKPLSARRLFSITMIGFMANNVLPFRLGEFVRAYSLSNKEQVSKSASMATIFVERIVFDLIMLLIIFGIVILFSPLQKMIDEIRYGVIVTLIIALTGVVVTLYLSTRRNRDSRLMKRILGFLPRKIGHFLNSMLDRFSTGLEFIWDGRRLFLVTFHTLMIWVVMGLSNYFIFLVFGFQLPIAASFVLLVVVSILIMAPSSPGFVGVYHYGAILSLSFYDVPSSEAVSCALVMHATQFMVITLAGFYYLRKEHLSLKQIEEEAEKHD